jgi:hypothetical protein
MNVSNEDARESLAAVTETMLKTRRAVAAAYSSPLLILWGLLFAVANAVAHFYLKHTAVIFWTMAGVGWLGTFLVWWRLQRNLPVKEPTEEKTNWRIWAMWGALSIYIFIWLNLLAPFNGMQMHAFIVTSTMFGYIVLGLWFAAYFMVWLGLAVTATTLIGFYLLGPYYCLWMAVTAGGLLLGTGLYLHARWR